MKKPFREMKSFYVSGKGAKRRGNLSLCKLRDNRVQVTHRGAKPPRAAGHTGRGGL